MKKTNTIKLSTLLFLICFICSCGKFLEIPAPKDSAAPEDIFADDVIATSAVTGIYSRMANSTSITVYTGLTSDELRSYSLNLEGFFKNEIPTSGLEVRTVWSDLYSFIYTSNSIIEGLQRATQVTEATKNQLLGEAKFVRAFCYFYLTNLFGDVPLHLTTDYRINNIAGKSTKQTIYNQIQTDLLDAENLLASNYVTSERIRPNKWAAKALLARVYLYLEKWDLAAQKANDVIEQKAIYSLVDDLDKVFLKNSTEAIWQLMPAAGGNTPEGALFVLNSIPTQVSLSASFYNAFEVGDNRKTKWTNLFTNATGTYYYPFKYKVKSSTNITEYSMVLRLSELHLIRAEARAKMSLPGLALEDLNLIRKRAGLITPLVGFQEAQCLDEIAKQRRFELFSEWGHRWLDLKRTGNASVVLKPIKGITWQDTDVLYPIPDNEVNRNPNIGQNPGYQY